MCFWLNGHENARTTKTSTTTMTKTMTTTTWCSDDRAINDMLLSTFYVSSLFFILIAQLWRVKWKAGEREVEKNQNKRIKERKKTRGSHLNIYMTFITIRTRCPCPMGCRCTTSEFKTDRPQDKKQQQQQHK